MSSANNRRAQGEKGIWGGGGGAEKPLNPGGGGDFEVGNDIKNRIIVEKTKEGGNTNKTT